MSVDSLYRLPSSSVLLKGEDQEGDRADLVAQRLSKKSRQLVRHHEALTLDHRAQARQGGQRKERGKWTLAAPSSATNPERPSSSHVGGVQLPTTRSWLDWSLSVRTLG